MRISARLSGMMKSSCCAFETDELIKFRIIIELRTTRVSDYITSDTPMIVCVKKDIVPMIQSLG